MQVTLTFSTGKTECHVMRLLDMQRKSVIIACPWRQTPAETYRQVRHLLSDEEAAEVAEPIGCAELATLAQRRLAVHFNDQAESLVAMHDRQAKLHCPQ